MICEGGGFARVFAIEVVMVGWDRVLLLGEMPVSFRVVGVFVRFRGAEVVVGCETRIVGCGVDVDSEREVIVVVAGKPHTIALNESAHTAPLKTLILILTQE